MKHQEGIKGTFWSQVGKIHILMYSMFYQCLQNVLKVTQLVLNFQYSIDVSSEYCFLL